MRREGEGRQGGPIAWIRDRYGSVTGLGVHVQSYAFSLIAVDREKVDWTRVGRLVYVCKGNVCRSPFAEVVARSRDLPAISYGLDADPGTAVNDTAARIAQEMGVDVRSHKSRRWSIDEISDSDLVLCVEPAHLRRIKKQVLEKGAQVSLLGMYSCRPRPYIHDPYGAQDAYFHRCFVRIREAVDNLAEAFRRGKPGQ